MTMSETHIWLIIIGMGVGTFLIRFSFLGIIGDRKLPDWVLRHLRYTPVAVMPGLVAPLVIWPQATGGHMDPARMAAAVATVAIGTLTRNVMAAIFGGAGVLYLVMWLVG